MMLLPTENLSAGFLILTLPGSLYRMARQLSQ
jgi:hypothetical protein